MTERLLSIENIQKQYEGQPLLRGISLTVDSGETLCLLGRSGSGKSTLLRIIAGLEQPDAGRVMWQGQDLARVPVHLRRFGLMFQDFALFPHRNVAENVAFGLRMQHLADDEVHRRVAEALEQVNLLAFARRSIVELSGGEQQRVALARALAPRPRLLMLDEPLGSLDRALKVELLDELRRLLHATRIPAIYVTHDQGEAFALADRLALLHDGSLVQVDEPQKVYQQPATTWVAQFFGLTNLVTGVVSGVNPLRVDTTLGPLLVSGGGAPPVLGSRVVVLIRPAVEACGDDIINAISGVVQDVLFQGEWFTVMMACNGIALQFNMPEAPRVGETIHLNLAPEQLVCLEDR